MIKSEKLRQSKKTLANTPIAQLLRKEELCYGFVDHVNNERGHIILKFPKDKGPRLKVLKSLTLVTLTAVNELGSKPSMWSCTLKDFMSNNAYHKGIYRAYALVLYPQMIRLTIM